MPSFPYLAKATIKYKSPHKQDLTFAKGETIRVTGVAPKTDTAEDDDDDDDDDWLVGETLDGARSGTFPGSFVEPSDEVDETPSHEADAKLASVTAAPSAAGAIPAELPTDLQSSVVEEEPPSHQAETVPEAAREAAQKGETEQAGFGAPLPPRPPSPDQDDNHPATASDLQTGSVDPASAADAAADVGKDTEDLSKAPGGVAVVGAAPGAAATVDADEASDALKVEAASTAAATEAKGTASSPTKSPPAVASKPVGMSSSFRDRLAAFNKPADAAPPPLPKGKPGGWKRPTPASNETKPLLPGAPASASTTASARPPPASQPIETKETSSSSELSGAGGAFSAADAQTSIKMSLKERMAALQRNEAAAADAAPQIKPKPAAPGKIGADRRNVALQGMGLAPGAQVPARKSSFESGRSTDEAVVESTATQDGLETDAKGVAGDNAGSEARDAAEAEVSATGESEKQPEESAESKEALTEEQQEAERRAAIAKRMAALGARRMGGGGPMPFGAPTPPQRAMTGSSIGSAEGTTSEPGISIPAETPAAESKETVKDAPAPTVSDSGEPQDSDVRSPTSTEAGEEPKVLAVPRRTAAPRKRKLAPQTAAVAAGATAAIAAATGGAAIAGEDESETTASAAVQESDEKPSHATVDQAEEAPAADPEEEATSLADEKIDAATVEPVEAQHAPESDDLTEQQEPANQQLEESDTEIAENQRQLEEYLRGEGFYEDQADPSAQHESEYAAAALGIEQEAPHAQEEIGQPRAVQDVPREDVVSPKPPSRPPSTRPPVPKTTLPAPPPVAADHDDAVVARAQSPSVPGIAASLSRRGSLIPPVPATTLPTPVEEAADEVNEPESQAQEVEEEAGPVLAAPKPRMAVPTEDPEDEELLAAADTPAAAVANEEEEAVGNTDQEQPEEKELTEEEQEAQRRANLARRMAALGGQRIGMFPGMAPPPIMGAPMPARKASVQAAEETEGESRAVDDAEQAEQDGPLSPIRGPPRGGMAIPGLTAVPGMNAQQAEDDALETATSPDAPARLASPPPVPTSPPPKPTSPPPPTRSLPAAGGESTIPPLLPPGRPSSTVPMANLDEAIRSASPANSSLGRRTSMKPPVPQGISTHSRESSAMGEPDLAQDRALATSPPPLPVSPPPLPVSPPPRPSSRAPPLLGLSGVPPRRQGSSASYASMGAAAGQPDIPAVPSATTTPATELPSTFVPARTDASLPPTPAAQTAPMGVHVGARQSSRDLDLMPSSRWWRHGVNPLRLPPTVAGRPDAILYADTSSSTDTGVAVHRADVYMLFEDYSTTVISLSFQDDDLEETHTSLSQRHNFAPPKPSGAELKQWSSSIGASIAKLASDAAKQSNTPIGDGSPRAFVQHVLSSNPSTLPPVGTSLGALVLTQVGPTVMESGADEVRPGDIVLCSQADFRGKKGLAPYHTTLGQTEPTPAIVVEVESKKNKLRCILQSASHSKKGLPDEVSLRLDDLKSGIVKVFRVPPRHGWVQDW